VLVAFSSGFKEESFIPVIAHALKLAHWPATGGGVAFPQMTAKGGVIAGVPVLSSDQLTNTAVLVDASGLAVAAEGLSVDIIRHATIDMNLGSSPSQPVNLWQNNLRALRAERWWDVTILRSSAVASLSGVPG